MVVTNDYVLVLQQSRKEEIKTYDAVVQHYSCLDVCFRIVFKFVEFSVLFADEVFMGKRYSGAVYGILKVGDDGSIGHRGQVTAIINGCTDELKERLLHEEMHQYGVFESIKNNNASSLMITKGNEKLKAIERMQRDG